MAVGRRWSSQIILKVLRAKPRHLKRYWQHLRMTRPLGMLPAVAQIRLIEMPARVAARTEWGTQFEAMRYPVARLTEQAQHRWTIAQLSGGRRTQSATVRREKGACVESLVYVAACV